jgi:hypothetical protein
MERLVLLLGLKLSIQRYWKASKGGMMKQEMLGKQFRFIKLSTVADYKEKADY